MDYDKKIMELKIKLPAPPAKGGLYSSIKKFGDKLIYVSGNGPAAKNFEAFGKLGSDLTLEEGQAAARSCMLNVLASITREYGSLNVIKSFVKIIVFVASDNDFYMQPQVANGATQLLLDIFGEEAGLPARSAIGVNVLPGNIPVEIEALLEMEEGHNAKNK